MTNWMRKPSWSPYVVGAGIGALSWFAFLSADAPLGISTTFVRAVAFVENAVAPEHVSETPYLKKNGPKVDWQLLLVIGVVAGAWLSARFSGERSVERVPALWASRFGPGVVKRYAAAFAGGLLVMFGARLADG